MKTISIVVSVFNEEEVLHKFYERFQEVCPDWNWDHELIFVDDGSRDVSLEILKEISGENEKVKVISFSRNFGHEAAMIAGIDYAKGDGIVCMDADLQPPLECIAPIIEKLEEGYDVINMIRTSNRSAGVLKNITSKAFYKVVNALSDASFEESASDFLR